MTNDSDWDDADDRGCAGWLFWIVMTLALLSVGYLVASTIDPGPQVTKVEVVGQ